MLSLGLKFMLIESKALLKIPKLKNPIVSVRSQNYKKEKKASSISSNRNFPQRLTKTG
jgi:hypothetical protein